MKTQVPLFQVGGTVIPPFFIGREKELNEIVNGIKSLSQNYLVLGTRRIGKSSLLANIVTRIEKRKDLMIIQINCFETSNSKEFSGIVTEKILEKYESKFKVKGSLEIFKRSLAETTLAILKSIESIGGSIKKIVEINIAFRESRIEEHELIKKTFEFVENFAKEKKLKIIIIFDEFQKVAEFDGYVFKFLKSHIDRTKQVRYIFSGSSISLLKDVFFTSQSPLYLMTSKIYLKPIEKDAIKRFIESRLSIHKIRIDKEALNRLVEFSGGIPYYFQKLADISYRYTLELKKRIDKQVVELANKKMIDELSSEFEERYETVFSPRQRAIIKAITLGNKRISAIARALKLPLAALSKDTRLLVESMSIERIERGRYDLQDKVFGEWLFQKFK